MLDTDHGLEIDIEGNENASLISKMKSQGKQKFENVASSVTASVEEKTGDLSKPNYLWMAITFAVGCLFLLAALTSLPFILISPAGFNLYFSLATTSLMLSVSFYHGPKNYIKTLFEKKNIAISTLFILSTLASLSTIFVKAGYLWSIGLVIL